MGSLVQHQTADPARADSEAFHRAERTASPSRRQSGDGVRSIERALSVLTAFSTDDPEQGLAAISENIGLPKSTTHRLLRTLEQSGFVERGQASGSYRLGPRTAVIGSIAQRTQLLDPGVQQTLEELRDATGETMALSTLLGRKFLMILKAESQKALRYSLAAGLTAPAHTCAGGKMLLACLSDGDVRRLYGDRALERPTEKSIASLDELLADLRGARSRGFAVDDEEWGVGLRAIAVPIPNAAGSSTFAVSMCAPAARVNMDELVRGTDLLREGAAHLSALFRGPRR